MFLTYSFKEIVRLQLHPKMFYETNMETLTEFFSGISVQFETHVEYCGMNDMGIENI